MGLGGRLSRAEAGRASPSRRQLWGKAAGQEELVGSSHRATFKALLS